MYRSAVLSDCGKYRYVLRRGWGVGDRCAVFLMLNPSTADAAGDDPTIRKCIGFARHWGFDALSVVNLYALRSTNPRGLLLAADPIGPLNDLWIRKECSESAIRHTVIAAWGANGDGRDRRVAEVCALVQRPMYSIGITATGQPLHPLMVAYAAAPMPIPWEYPAREKL